MKVPRQSGNMGNDSWKVGELLELLVSKLPLNISFYSLLECRDSNSVSQMDYQYNPQYLPVYLEQKSVSLSLCPVVTDREEIWDSSRLPLHHILAVYSISTNFSVCLCSRVLLMMTSTSSCVKNHSNCGARQAKQASCKTLLSSSLKL